MVLVVQIPVQLISLKNFTGIKLFLYIILYIVGFGIAISLATWAYRSVWRQKSHKLTKSDFKLIVIALLTFYVIEIVMQLLNGFFFHQIGTKNNAAILDMLKNNPTVLVLMSISMVFLSPILEELVFRGYLIRGLFFKTNSLIPIIFSGLIFSCGHMSSNIISFMIYAFLGMILAYVYLKTDKIEVSIGVHFANNLVATIFMLITIL